MQQFESKVKLLEIQSKREEQKRQQQLQSEILARDERSERLREEMHTAYKSVKESEKTGSIGGMSDSAIKI